MRKGFTLIELSIVLVIIGLIVGGVLVGQDLIEGAKIRKVISEKEQYLTTINVFRSKYSCLPGDCPYAQDFFGGSVYEGDGDQYIDDRDGFISTANEIFAFWEHLAAAEMIPGSYDGTVNFTEVPGVDSPASAYGNNVGWHVFTAGENNNYWGFGTSLIHETYGNLLAIGGVDTHTARYFAEGYINALGAKQIDDKVDDGGPSSGSVRAIRGLTSTDCVTGVYTATNGSLDWDFSPLGKNCRMVFFFKR